MALNNVTFQRQNGGVPATLPGEDHYSGLLAFVNSEDLPAPSSDVAGFTATDRIKSVSSIETAEKLGIKSDASKWEIRVLHYHLSEIYRINPAVVLWVGLFDKPEDAYNFTEIKTMQLFSEGKIRQIGVYCPDKLLAADDLTTIQGIATNLEANDMPLSVVYSPKIDNIANLTNLSTIGLKNVSVVIGQAGSGIGLSLYEDAANKDKNTVGVIGNCIGTISKAAVHQSIGWVGQFPSGISLPAFGDGTLLRDVDTGVIDTLNTNRYLFLRTFVGLAGSFYNDSHTMDLSTSDYNAIERVRTMDKAVRGIRTYLLPELGSNVYIEPETGKLTAMSVAHLTNVAGKQLEDMDKVGELSGYVVEIDPNQNVLSISEVEIVIKQVGAGVMRNVKVKIGFTNKI